MSHFFPPETVSRELPNDTGPFFCYVLWIPDTCQYYVGHTNDPDRRIKQHLSGTVDTTQGHSIDDDVWVSRKMGTREGAQRFEAALKNYITSKKGNDFERCTGLEFDYGATLLELEYEW